ncbi:MAG: glucosamine-6-phosphate deaminase [Patescibacteria group bacterium]|nr:glucosamine-6-phosphate deaminase [Patescibacteria group bacterium]
MKIIKSAKTDFDIDAANIVISVLKESVIIALPTGTTPLGMYRELVKAKINWSKIKIFMLDVNYPQDPKDPESFYSFSKKYLPTDKFNILDCRAKDPEAECLQYEAKIQAAGGLDLAVLGIGVNGHIAYNEPGTSFDSLTHLAKLQNQKFKFGLTMGIKTIMSAQKIILLAKGKEKAVIVKRAVEGPVNESCPASILQTHRDVTFILDQEAASRLK